MKTPEEPQQLRSLNKQVTTAIFHAEHSHGYVETRQRWLEVCRLEQEIATITDASSMEGYYSRSGAVAAALKSGSYSVANQLTESYLQQAIPDQVKKHIKKMVSDVLALYEAKDVDGATMRALACDGPLKNGVP